MHGLPLVWRGTQDFPRDDRISGPMPALPPRHEARLALLPVVLRARSSKTLSIAEYSDRRYTARCPNRKCDRKKLMPFMRYCPWCHTKVRQKWKIEGSDDTLRQVRLGRAARILVALPVVCGRSCRHEQLERTCHILERRLLAACVAERVA